MENGCFLLFDQALAEDDRLEGAVQARAGEIVHHHAGGYRHVAADLDCGLWDGGPVFVPTVIHLEIGVATGIHRFDNFAFQGDELDVRRLG